MAKLTGAAASVRALRAAVVEAVCAAQAEDGTALAGCRGALAGLDEQRLRIVQGELVRSLLEELHPDGLSAADAQDLLERCVRDTAAWYPSLDPAVLVVVLIGSLGVQDPDEQPAAAPATVAEHAAVLTAELIKAEQRAGEPGAAVTGDGAEQRADRFRDRANQLLDRALAELERAETMEMP
jgi:hypothetical protein